MVEYLARFDNFGFNINWMSISCQNKGVIEESVTEPISNFKNVNTVFPIIPFEIIVKN